MPKETVFVRQSTKFYTMCIHKTYVETVTPTADTERQLKLIFINTHQTHTYTFLPNRITGHGFVHRNVLLNNTQCNPNSLIHKHKYLELSIWRLFKANSVAQ